MACTRGLNNIYAVKFNKSREDSSSGVPTVSIPRHATYRNNTTSPRLYLNSLHEAATDDLQGSLVAINDIFPSIYTRMHPEAVTKASHQPVIPDAEFLNDDDVAAAATYWVQGRLHTWPRHKGD